MVTLEYSSKALFVLNFFLIVPISHNTKTTSWLDPRTLDKPQKPLEESEDDGMSLYAHDFPTCCLSNLLFIYLAFADLQHVCIFKR